MAEYIGRALRDGSLEGEHAVALTIKDSLHSPFGSHAFDHFLCSLASNISSAKAQARGLLLVALHRSPSFYFNLLKSRGLSVSSSDKWFQMIDCHSDPLGWKEKLGCPSSNAKGASAEETVSVFRDVRDADKLLSLILNHGRGAAGDGKARFAVAIDSVSILLRHVSLPSVANLINNIRSHDKVSSIFWLIRSDLHELRQSTAFEYISTMVASLEPQVEPTDRERTISENLFFLEQNSLSGKFLVRLKRRNGRVKVLNEQFHMEQACIRFSAAAAAESGTAVQNLLPKVQFNLQLSEKERADRSKVVLPFEHQGNGEEIQIYDGRQSLSEGEKGPNLPRPVSSFDQVESQNNYGKGEIHYVRDSDDEMPDSDEDPDDDLDI